LFLIWEILNDSKLGPFSNIQNEMALAVKVHRGERPSIHVLVRDTPQDIIDMIVNCWDKDRSKD
jgi:hypothetical protein